MSLNLYRRHRRECVAGHTHNSFSSELDERRKAWKRCECPIIVSGTLRKRFRRHSTGQWEWAPAKAIAAQFETGGSWNAEVESSQLVIPEDLKKPTVTISRAVTSFLAVHEQSSALGTLRANLYFLKKFSAYSENRGYLRLDQWAPINVREFYASWGCAPTTATRNMMMLKSFFGFCVSNEWIERNPAKQIKESRGRKSTEKKERIPFSDEELKRMFDACENRYGKVDGELSWRFRWTGRDLADFISVSVYTGLRISDVATFHIDRLQESGECHIRTTKTGKKVYTWLPPWLQVQIRERAKKHGPKVFGTYATSDTNVITDVWRRKLNRLWELCGTWDEKPTPHRFRHTFARVLLQKANVTVRDVAELLGNTEAMILKHYSAWIPARQERLTALLKEAFDDKPKPKLLSIR
jgi:integrase